MMPMRLIIFLVSLLFLHVSQAATPIIDRGIVGLSSGDSIQSSVEKLESLCEKVYEVSVEPPSFPLAETSEIHLICRNLSMDAKTVGAIALTFADDKLVMIYAQDNAADLFLGYASEPVREYLQFSASFTELLVADRTKDQAWVLTSEAAHPNLFMWTNPYVAGSNRVEYEPSAKVPEILGFGRTLDELLPLYETQCDFSHLGTYRVWLLNRPEVQQQVDCFGFEFAGFPRKIEAVFGDGILEQVWILTGKGEEGRVRQALIAEYGEPIFVNEQWEVFHGKQVMLRKDKPEVLMLSEKLADLFYDDEID
jgi:hypothetical protein